VYCWHVFRKNRPYGKLTVSSGPTIDQASALQKNTKKRKGKENLSKANAQNSTPVVQEATGVAAAVETPAAGALAPPPEERDPVPWSEVELPLLPHTLLKCKWRDGTMRPARIIERRPLKGGGADDWEYYVHYRQVDRRMDCWKLLEDFDTESIVPPRIIDPMDPKYVPCHHNVFT
jgi:hypothetical protein